MQDPIWMTPRALWTLLAGSILPWSVCSAGLPYWANIENEDEWRSLSCRWPKVLSPSSDYSDVFACSCCVGHRCFPRLWNFVWPCLLLVLKYSSNYTLASDWRLKIRWNRCRYLARVEGHYITQSSPALCWMCQHAGGDDLSQIVNRNNKLFNREETAHYSACTSSRPSLLGRTLSKNFRACAPQLSLKCMIL